MASSLTPDDVRILEKTLNIREQVVDNLMKGDLPTKAREVDSFVNLLESMDRSVLGRAKIKIEESSQQVDEATKQVLTDLLLSLHSGKVPEGLGLDEASISAPAFESTGDTVLEGELIRKTDFLSMDVLDNLD